MKYRREIDGLRALAVIPVILFHAGFQSFSGGFVGVDIFFVISGYLIATIILAELEGGKFSLVNFYERRARRILPALFLVLAACLPFAWSWLLPRDAKDFSQSLIAVSSFASNILFWQESGYFDTSAELKPLLHTWSLAVEEQFYVIFPLFMVVAWRLGREWIVKLLGLGVVVSLAIAHWGAFNQPQAAFFLLPTRAWELSIGALTAFFFARREYKELSTSTNQLLSLTGLVLITLSVFVYDKNTPFPGLYALAPTIGAALVILFAWPQTHVGRLLGSKVFVGVGLISYSAYLWHQPVFAFARHRSLEKPSLVLVSFLVMLTLAIAYLSWRFVERPFRVKGNFERRTVFAFAAIGSVSVAVFGLYGQVTDGYLQRVTYKNKAFLPEHRLRFNHGLSPFCDGQINTSPECRTSDEPEVILWGDSYAMHLAQGLVASKPDIRLVQATVSMCGPVLDAAPTNHEYTKSWAASCSESNDKVLEYIKQTKSLKYVVLGSFFEQYASDDWKLLLRDGTVVSSKKEGINMLKRTLQTLRDLGLTPIVFATTPQVGRNIGRCLGKAMLLDIELSQCNVSLQTAREYQRNVRDFFSKVEMEAPVVWFDDEICLGDVCRAAIGSTLIYRDQGHLSYEGSAFLGKKMNFYEIISGAH